MTEVNRIAILGAGPIGLDAALAAAERGMPFTVYEADDEVGGHLRSWGHLRLFTPWSMNVSARIRAHLKCAGVPVPDGEGYPTAAEFRERVLLRVAELPEIAPHLETHTRVLEVGREGLLKHEEIASAARQARPFRLLLRDASGRERTACASRVLDTTGTWSHPNALGDGGIAAPGEAALSFFISHELPDPADPSWQAARVLLVGAGHSAQTAARTLAARASVSPGWVWAMRREPAPPLPNDPLPERSALVRAARAIADCPPAGCEVFRGVVVERLRREGDRIAVSLRPLDEGGAVEVVVDRVLALVGGAPDASLYRQLQIHECYASAAPMKLAAALLGTGGASADCLDQTAHGVAALASPEPDFFILGVKSYGRNSNFLLRVGYSQVDEVFAALD